MVEEVRSMWYDTLEELLQCPVCLEAAVGPKFQCTNGHHICTSCRTQMNSCPLCKSYILATRNLAVEQITAQLEEIKLSLLHPYHALNRRILKGKVCVATQTENYISTTTLKTSWCQTSDTCPPIVQPNNSNVSSILSPKIGKGQYPCRIGTCELELPHGRMIGHLRYFHKDVFMECYKKLTVFKRSLLLDYKYNQSYDYAFFVGGMGLFFLNMHVSERGDFTGFLRIVNCNESAKQFTYSLLTGNGPRKMCYTGVVKSCRVEKQFPSNDCLHVHNDIMRCIVNTKKNNFFCYLTIQRKIGQSTNIREENLTLDKTFMKR